MTGKIFIDNERCKGCGLCVAVCTRNGIAISKHQNKSGYFPAQPNGADCTGCAACAIICPDAAITVARESPVVAVESAGKTRTRPVKESSRKISKNPLTEVRPGE